MNFNRYPSIFIQENTFQNVIWKMVSILSLPQLILFDTTGMLLVIWLDCPVPSFCQYPGELCCFVDGHSVCWWINSWHTWVQILAMLENENLSPFDLKSHPCGKTQSKLNKHVYRECNIWFNIRVFHHKQLIQMHGLPMIFKILTK